MLLLQQHHIAPTPSKDVLMWLRSPGKFSATSVYRFLAYTPSPSSDLRYIWQIKAPLRVMKIFAWLLHTNRLTTIDNLVKRGWNLPNMCTMCNSDAETIQHLFQSCPLAIQIRLYIVSAFTPAHPIPIQFTSPNSTNMLIDPKENIVARNWEITTCYVLWRERCRRIFSDKMESHLSLVREIRSELKAWFEN